VAKSSAPRQPGNSVREKAPTTSGPGHHVRFGDGRGPPLTVQVGEGSLGAHKEKARAEAREQHAQREGAEV
jgi:hypothetical protein